MGKSAMHKTWSDAKDLAKRRFDRALPPEDFLDQAGGQERSTWPLRFEGGLGPLLDEVTDVYDEYRKVAKKYEDEDYERVKQAEQKVEGVRVRARRLLESYQEQVRQHQDTLAELDPEIATTLLDALAHIDESLGSVAVAKGGMKPTETLEKLARAHDDWKKAKADSEKRFKTLAKDKDVAALLKTAKLTDYPVDFKGGLGPALDKARAAAKAIDRETAGKEIRKAVKIAEAYLEAIDEGAKKLEKAKVPKKDVEEVFEPATTVLKKITKKL